jgi:hypothetical protein
MLIGVVEDLIRNACSIGAASRVKDRNSESSLRLEETLSVGYIFLCGSATPILAMCRAASLPLDDVGPELPINALQLLTCVLKVRVHGVMSVP